MRLACIGMILLSSCAVPRDPTIPDMDLLDRAFREPSDPTQAEALLKKDELTLEDALRLADLLNPRLESIRKDVDLAPLGAWQDSLFPNPSLLLEVEEFPTEESRRLGASERGFGISQAIPIGGRLGASSSVAAGRRSVAAMRYVWERRKILTEVKQAFIQLLASGQNVALARETLDIAGQFHDLTNERFKAQAIPEMELLKAAVNRATAEADLRAAQSAAAVAIKRLHALLGDTDFPIERFQGELHVRFELPSLESLKGQVIVEHPELEIARRQKDLADRELGLARAERIPDIGADLLFAWTPEEDRILEAGLSIPLPLFNRNQGRIVGAEVRRRQAELALQGARNGAALSLIEAYRGFAAAQERVTGYRETILPKAEEARSQTDEGYKAGKFSYLDVLDAQRTLSEARSAYLSALQDLNRLAAELEKVTGRNLQAIR